MLRRRLNYALLAICTIGLAACKKPPLGLYVVTSSVTWLPSEVLALHSAIRSGDGDTVDSFVKAKGNCRAVGTDGATPLYCLFQNSKYPGGAENRYKIATILFRAGADPNELLPRHLSTPGTAAVVWALHQDTVRMTKLFLDAGVSPELRNEMLFAAVGSNSIESVTLLLAAGAQINHTDESGQNCLFRANTVAMGRLLVERGVNLEQRTTKGKTAVSVLSDEKRYCGSGGCTEIPAEEMALAHYLRSAGAR